MKPKPKGALRLLSWNVNGLRAILQKGFLEVAGASGADYICLQEIKARPEQLAGVEWPPGWQIAWNPAERPGYSGTAIISRDKPLAAQPGIGRTQHDDEGRVLTADLGEFFLVNTYVPNVGRDLARLDYRANSWSPAFLNFLGSLRRRKPVVVCGDLNVAHQELDLARPRENVGNAGFTNEERAAFRDLLESGFLDTFREFEQAGGHYTWWSYQNRARERNIGWRIDYFLITPELRPRLCDAFICPQANGSDHCPVGIDLLSK